MQTYVQVKVFHLVTQEQILSLWLKHDLSKEGCSQASNTFELMTELHAVSVLPLHDTYNSQTVFSFDLLSFSKNSSTRCFYFIVWLFFTFFIFLLSFFHLYVFPVPVTSSWAISFFFSTLFLLMWSTLWAVILLGDFTVKMHKLGVKIQQEYFYKKSRI